MKKMFKRVVSVMLAAMMMPVIALAQNDQMLQPLPTDPAVRIGKLDNGLTYYIRHNEYPKGQADFYIAQSVGSALEEDNQRGLAHFLEHMCFNGTTHFPDNTLREWLESIGVKFGDNLNAYTSIDETVYNISNVPVARESVQDSCLLILHDWANDLTLAPEEIDKERGVIHEEWRRSMVGSERIDEKILPDLFPTTKYGYRLPIGTMEVVDNFPHQALRDYYEAWYRPDQQAIVVVGDIDVDRIEGKIKEMFADIEMPADAPARTYQPVPDHEGTLYGIGEDPEQTVLRAELMWISDPLPKEANGSITFLMQQYMQHIIAQMLNQRLEDLASKPDAPFAAAGSYFGHYILTKTKDAYTTVVIAKDNDIIDPLQALYREVLRAQRGGFTHSEYERAKSDYLSMLERAYNNRETTQNESYVNEYVRHFLDGYAMPGIETEWQLVQMIASQIPVEMINMAFAETITPDNRALKLLSPQKEGYTLPTKEQLAAALAAVDAEEIEGFVDEVKAEPLVEVAPVAGKIVSVTENPLFGTTEWTLSNGAKVIIKQTKFKADEILFEATARGGYSGLAALADTSSVGFMPVALQQNGLGSYTSSDLTKYLAGKNVGIEASFNPFSRDIEGATTPKDLPAFMEILYMTFKDIQWTEDEYNAIQKSYASIVANRESDPQFVWSREVSNGLFKSPFRHVLTAKKINEAKREVITDLVHKMTANAADWTFVFVGNVDLDSLRPLVETYIASLPGDASTAVKNFDAYDPGFYITPGKANVEATTAMETPQTWVYLMGYAQLPYDVKNAQIAGVAGQILTNRLIKTVREDMGAVYSIRAYGQASRTGFTPFTLMTQFPMKPEMKAEVLDYIAGQFKAMESDVTDAELAPIKEYMVKNYTENRELNQPWLNAITGYLVNGVDTFNPAIESMNSITVDDVMNYMKQLNAAGNYSTVVLDPAN